MCNRFFGFIFPAAISIAGFSWLAGCGSSGSGGSSAALFQKDQQVAYFLSNDASAPVRNLALKATTDKVIVYSGLIEPDSVAPDTGTYNSSKQHTNFTAVIEGQGVGNVKTGEAPGGASGSTTGSQTTYSISWNFDIKTDSVDAVINESVNLYGAAPRGTFRVQLHQVNQQDYLKFLKTTLYVVEAYTASKTASGGDKPSTIDLRTMCQDLFGKNCDQL